MKHIQNMKKNEHAVSPIVATLVLIVVAVVGAVAVGTIMGTFSGEVSKETNTGDVAGASQTEILVAGSTTIQPAAQQLATDYMDDHPGVKVTVQGGGSGAGLSAVVNKVVDVGMMSEDMTTTQKTAYPEVEQHKVGVSGVVLIIDADATAFTADPADVKTAYDTDTPSAISANLTKLYTRSSVSGTADTFASFFDIDDIYAGGVNITGESSNSNIANAIAADLTAAGAATRFGFVDAEYALTRTDIKMVEIDGYPMGTSYTRTEIKNAYNGDDSAFPTGLARPLILITNGEPSPVVKSFITYMQSPAAKTPFNDLQLTHISELVVA